MTDPNAENPRQSPPVRNMADIARMFLDGARPTPEAGAPRRTGPQQRTPSAAAQSLPVSAASSPWIPSMAKAPAVATQSPLTLPRVMLALTAPDPADPPSPRRNAPLAAAATRLAKEHHTSVGILALCDNQFTIEIVGLQLPADLPPIKPSAGLPDVQIARALFTLRHAVDHWILAAPDADSPGFPRLAASIPDWLVITPIANDHVVSAYQQLKRALAISSPAHDPLAVMLSADSANAAIVHSRLRRAAAEFLNKDLPLAAIAAPSSAPPLHLATLPVGCQEADHAAVYAAVLDELCGAVDETEPEIDAEAESEIGPEARADPAPEFEDEIIEISSLADQHAANHAENHPDDAADPLESLEPFGGPAPEAVFDDAIGNVSIDIDGPLDAATAAAVDLALNADQAEKSSSALFDQLTHVLDPDERDALNADLFADPAPPDDQIEPANRRGGEWASPPPPVADSPIRPLAHSCASPLADSSPLTLRAQDLRAESPTDRPAQWQAVEQSVPDLVRNSILLDARPPMSWAAESCLALDAAGMLHVWTLYNSSVSWFALKHWAVEHAALLALTRRDLKFTLAAPITVHIVLPLENLPDPQSEISTLLRTASHDLFLYRLRPLEWNTKRALLVIPLS